MISGFLFLFLVFIITKCNQTNDFILMYQYRLQSEMLKNTKIYTYMYLFTILKVKLR